MHCLTSMPGFVTPQSAFQMDVMERGQKSGPIFCTPSTFLPSCRMLCWCFYIYKNILRLLLGPKEHSFLVPKWAFPYMGIVGLNSDSFIE